MSCRGLVSSLVITLNEIRNIGEGECYRRRHCGGLDLFSIIGVNGGEWWLLSLAMSPISGHYLPCPCLVSLDSVVVGEEEVKI